VNWTEDTVTDQEAYSCGPYEFSPVLDSAASTFNPEGDSSYDAALNSVD